MTHEIRSDISTERPDTPDKRAVLFIRVNRRGVGDDETADRHIEMQRNRGQDAARLLGAVVIREYVDNGGAVGIAQRPELRAILDELTELRDADYVIANSWAQLSRVGEDRPVIARTIEDAGAQVIESDGDVQAQASGQSLGVFAAPSPQHLAGGHRG